jgi:hypothetical protein
MLPSVTIAATSQGLFLVILGTRGEGPWLVGSVRFGALRAPPNIQ